MMCDLMAWTSCSLLGHLKHRKFVRKNKTFGNAGLKFCQIIIELSKNAKDFVKVSQIDKIDQKTWSR